MKKKWSAGKIAGVILGTLAALFLLWITFLISIFQLASFLENLDSGTEKEKYEQSREQEESFPDEKEKDTEKDNSNEDGEDAPFFFGEEEYYEFGNAVRKDLSYQVTFESFVRDDFTEAQGSAYVEFLYPVIEGEVTNREGINAAIKQEVLTVEEHVVDSVGYLTEGETYVFEGTAFVTFMSEDILSVAYVEYGYLNGEYLESYVVSYNVDMQTGMMLKNSNLLAIDDKFSIDFRERCEKQNGEIEALSYFSDQEITACLTDDNYLIAFYTPLGMEIGFNYYSGWVTVTYQDYERYQKQF